jgi:ubiquinone/menaquinone biosynthesis C-methylase UbiE
MIVLLWPRRTIIVRAGEIKMCNRPRRRTLSVQEDWDLSAEEYATFASRNNFYRHTAETMLNLAEIEPGMVVVDLACGTGSVTEAIFREPYGKAVKIIAIDSSPQMLACAQRRLACPNVEFHCEKAENLGKVLVTPVDRILCNAAFWMFDKPRVLSKIQRILKPSGKCLMGLRHRFTLSEIRALYAENTLFRMILKEKAIRGYASTKWHDGKPQSDPGPKKNFVLPSVDDYNLKITKKERIAVHCTAKDHIDFLRIPVMAKASSLLAGVPDEKVREILDVVQNQVESMEVTPPPIPWHICVLEVKRQASKTSRTGYPVDHVIKRRR